MTRNAARLPKHGDGSVEVCSGVAGGEGEISAVANLIDQEKEIMTCQEGEYLGGFETFQDTYKSIP